MLQLDNADTDYYLKCYIALLYAHPDILEGLEQGEVSYAPATFPFRTVVTEGVELDPTANTPGLFDGRRPIGMPVPLTYTFTYLSATTLRADIAETGYSTILTCHTYADGIDVRFMPEFPFSGLLKLQQAWEPGVQLKIIAEPGNFPWSRLIETVEQSAPAIYLLNSTGLLNAYSVAYAHPEKAALILAAVAKSNKSVYPD